MCSRSLPNFLSPAVTTIIETYLLLYLYYNKETLMTEIYHCPTPGSLIQFFEASPRGSKIAEVFKPVALVLSVRPVPRRYQEKEIEYIADILIDGEKRQIFCWLNSNVSDRRRCVGHCDGDNDFDWWLTNNHVRWDVVS